MERGVRRLEIFQDDFDKMIFMEILRDELNKNECKLHAYCLMSNHFHFLLETGETEIGKFMKVVDDIESGKAVLATHELIED